MNADVTFTGMVERNLSFFWEMTNQLEETGYDSLDPYRDNLYRAITFGAQTPEQNLTAALLVLRCTNYIEQRCNYRHWAKLLTRIANRYEANHDPVTFAKLLSMTGFFRYQAGQLQQAERAYRSAERVAMQSEDNLAVATAWYYLSIMHYQRDEIDLAIPFTKRALNVLRDSELDEIGMEQLGYLLNLSSLLNLAVGDMEAAERDLLYASETLIMSDNVSSYRFIRYNLAKLRIYQGRYREAESLLQDELAYSSQNDLPASQAQAITRLTYLYIRQAMWESALEMCLQLDIVDLQKRGQLNEIGMAKNNLGFIYLHLDELDKAEAYLVEAISIWELLRRDVEIANSLASLAAVQLAKREFVACKSSCANALKHLDYSPQNSVRKVEVRNEIFGILRSVEESLVID